MRIDLFFVAESSAGLEQRHFWARYARVVADKSGFPPPSSYGLGPKRSLALAAFLKTFRAAEIRSLNIEGCGVPESAMAAVVQALKEGGRGLTALDISTNQIKRESTAKLVSGKPSTW